MIPQSQLRLSEIEEVQYFRPDSQEFRAQCSGLGEQDDYSSSDASMIISYKDGDELCLVGQEAACVLLNILGKSRVSPLLNEADFLVRSFQDGEQTSLVAAEIKRSKSQKS